MAKVIITSQVEDGVKWEAGFRTHGDLFRSHTISAPIHFTIVDGNSVVICFEPADLASFMKMLDSPATAEAMAFDGVKRETVKVYALDRELKL